MSNRPESREGRLSAGVSWACFVSFNPSCSISILATTSSVVSRLSHSYIRFLCYAVESILCDYPALPLSLHLLYRLRIDLISSTRQSSPLLPLCTPHVQLLPPTSTMITTVMLRRPLRGAAQTVGAHTESSFIALPSPPHISASQGHRYASSSSSPSKPVSLPPTPPKTYSTHLPLYSWQKSLLTFGSSLAALVNPARGDMIATLSEVSGETHLPRLRDEMLEHDEGRRLLVDRPSINTRTVDMSYLETLQPGTLGNEYTKWLEWCRVGPDTRAKVR